MTNGNLNFEKARYNGVVTVIADQIKQISNLEKKYKALQSEHKVLKRTYLNLLDGHLDIIDGKNKTIKRLRESKKTTKEKIVEDLEDLRYDYQYNNLNLKSFLDIIKEWEK